MIIDDLDERFTEAMAGTQAAAIDLTWNMTLAAVPVKADGRRQMLVQLILSCASPILGQRLWEAIDVEIAVLMQPPKQLHQIAFNFVQQMQAARQQVLQSTNGRAT